MGKAKKERARMRQARLKANDPAGLSAASLVPCANGGASPADRQELIETLTSGTPNQKAIACHAIAHLISNAAARPSSSSSSSHSPASSSSPFLHPQLLTRVIALLFASDYEARFSASVALHSLSSLSHRACESLVKQDAVTACLSLLSHPSLQQLDSAKRDRLLVEVVGIIRDLTENVDSVLVEMSNSASTVQSLFALLATEGTSARAVLVEVSSLLLQMTEQNDMLVSRINSTPSAVSLLMGLMGEATGRSLLRLNAAGIILNLQAPQHVALLTSAAGSVSSSSSSSSSSSCASFASVPPAVQAAMRDVVSLLSSALQDDVLEMSGEYVRRVRAERERMEAVLTEMEAAASDRRSVKKDEAEVEMKSGMEEVKEEEKLVRTEAESNVVVGETEMEVEEKPRPFSIRRRVSANEVERESQQRVDEFAAGWHERVNAVKLALELLSNLTAEEEQQVADGDDGEERKEALREEKESRPLTWLGQALLETDSFSHAVRLLQCQLGGEARENERDQLLAMVGDGYADDCLSLLSSVRCRAASFLTNLVLYLPLASIAPHLPTLLQNCGQRLTQLLAASSPASATSELSSPSQSSSSSPSPTQSSADRGIDEMESLTGLFFVISKTTHGTSFSASAAASSSSLPLFSPSNLQTLLYILTHPSTPPSIQLNMIDIIALIASHPSVSSLCIEPSSAAILSFMLPLCSSPVSSSADSLELLDRCLNALMDAYVEDGLHGEVLTRLGVLQGLQRGSDGLRKILGSKGGKVGREDRRRYQETLSNVGEFLRYKPNHV